jgi:nucleoside-diphosphate-sugar epimerase
MREALRITDEELFSRRRSCPARIFLTGGTGFLGSHLAAAFLERGHDVALLARLGRTASAAERVSRLMDWFGLGPEARRRLRVLEGDVTQYRLGLDPDAYRSAGELAEEVVHCASETSFSLRRRAEVERVNGEGLRRVLQFARESRALAFHHVSTAFVAGRTTGPCPEELVTETQFHNPYEETKCRGEHEVLVACAEAGIRPSIYRPSIVYGDSRTGRSLLFNAVYYPVRTALMIRDFCEADIRENGGQKAAAMGVRLEAGGTMRLPLRIAVAAEGGLNLVPVDHFVEAFLALREDAPEGGIFHIVNPRPKRIEDIVDYSSRLFRLRGISTVTEDEIARRPRNALERMFDQYLEVYRPYMLDRRAFARDRSGPLLERRGIACPEFDYENFRRCMTFAVEAGWGAKLPVS